MRRTIVASTLAFSITVAGALALFTVPVLASSPGAYDSLVTGKGDPSYDVKAVQDAVDKGGKILLKGTFDFGEKGRVNIKNDVEIIGETDTQAVALTKIKGGFWTFHSPLPPQLPPQAPGPKITIQGIHFDGALWTPINLPYSSGALIAGNKITNVLPLPSKQPVFGKPGLSVQSGISISGLYTKPKEPPRCLPGAITGQLTIERNDIDLSNEAPEKTFSEGVFVFGTTGATIRIIGNTITNCARNSIDVLDNSLDQDGNGVIIVKANRITTSPVGAPVPTPDTPNGIVVGWFLDQSGAKDPLRNPKFIVVGNHIETRGETSGGVWLLSDGVVLMSNDIILNGGPQAKGILAYGSNGLIAHNKIAGSGLCSMMALPGKVLLGCGNSFVDNNTSNFKASMAHVLLQGNNNLLVGACGKVVDKGEGNRALE
jgi:hypothetical protein